MIDETIVKALKCQELDGISLDLATFLLVGGSYAEGLSTVTSDIDIIAVFDNGQLPESLKDSFRSIIVSGQSFDILFIEVTRFHDAQDLSNRSYRTESTRSFEVINKLCLSKPLEGFEAVEELRRSFSRPMLARLQIDYFFHYMGHALDDLEGAYLSERLVTAACFSRQVGMHATDIYLAAKGDLFAKTKWRADRLSRLGENRVNECFRDLVVWGSATETNTLGLTPEARLINLHMKASRQILNYGLFDQTNLISIAATILSTSFQNYIPHCRSSIRRLSTGVDYVSLIQVGRKKYEVSSFVELVFAAFVFLEDPAGETDINITVLSKVENCEQILPAIERLAELGVITPKISHSQGFI
jgi:hypothetical protein